MSRRDPEKFLETVSALSSCLRGTAAQAYAELEVGSTQAKFLRHIAQNSRISQAELARATGTDPALAGRALETLIERGWVRRRRSKEDRRENLLELSALGERTRKKAEEARARVAAQVMAALSDRDVEDFERITKKVIAALAPKP